MRRRGAQPETPTHTNQNGLFVYQIIGLLGNGEFFVCGDNPDLDFGFVGGDFALFAVAIVGFEVDIDAEQAEFFAHFGADVGRILANSGSEDDGIDVTEHHGVCTDVFDDAIVEDVHGADGFGFAFGDAVFEHAAVVGNARQAEQTGLFVDEVVEFVGVHALGAAEVREDGGIDVTAASAHAEAFERRQAHGGIDGFAALNGGNRRTAAEVARNDVEIFDVFAEDFGQTIGDELVGRAVGAVAADVLIGVEAVGNRVEIGVFGDGLVERCVEDGDVGNAGKQFLCDFEADDVCGDVEWIERIDAFDFVDDALIDQAGFGEFFAAVDDAVADGLDFIEGFDGAVEQQVKDALETGFVRRENFVGDFDFFAVGRFVLEDADFFADALDVAFGEYVAGGHFEKLIFNSG